jgi:hypothetical protein
MSALKCREPELQAPFPTAGGADPASVEHIRNGPQRRCTGSLRLSDHRHDVGGKPIGLGLYAVYTCGLRERRFFVRRDDWAVSAISRSVRRTAGLPSGKRNAEKWWPIIKALGIKPE